MTNTEKRLEEFAKKFSDHGFDNGAENEFHSALIRRFISESIQQATAEERERVVMEIRKRVTSHDAVMEYLSSLDINNNQ